MSALSLLMDCVKLPSSVNQQQSRKTTEAGYGLDSAACPASQPDPVKDWIGSVHIPSKSVLLIYFFNADVHIDLLKPDPCVNSSQP